MGRLRVLHYVEHWLELSAGFVHGQVIRSRSQKVVVSNGPTENMTSFPVRPLVRLDRLSAVVPPRRWQGAHTAAMRAIATAYRADLVHVHFGYAVRDVLPIVDRRSRPLILSLHGDDVLALPTRQPGHYAPVIDAVSAVVVPSQFLAEATVDLGFDRDRIHVIPAGIDTTFFMPTALPDTRVVGFVGRLVEKKGVDVLLEAWPRVRDSVPGAELHVLGSGRLESLLRSNDRSVRHIRPDPARRADQVRELIRSATVIATPSRTAHGGDAESLLLVNLEAQASGRPVVTTDNGGIPEFIAPGESAIVVPQRDAAALADALVAVLTDEPLAQRLAAAGPAIARRFDVRDCAGRVDELYDSLRKRK